MKNESVAMPALPGLPQPLVQSEDATPVYRKAHVDKSIAGKHVNVVV
ncbi:MAG: hypothetical protein LUE26_08660 [Alistipes sp.]|nr:hypothetical protein [Alistipes sp.]